ncbi:hypothetical protein F4V43_10330 [Paenibacillus spiritus]|uniref:SLH domain-containing protein n=1 Tax=Paenibacillus spiritus TaxID=2496557 RepID=A0A5J5G9S1_9BACL|nr:S-layer homology domain-containing protein [Paenibacillus spiritus]KAA9004711.1 hypothetical protein F4V43_10330 [Paenibacillus spiritus]
MKQRMIQSWSACMAVLMLTVLLLGGWGTAGTASAASGSEAAQAAKGAAAYLLKGGISSDWQAIGLIRSGQALPERYKTDLVQEIKASKGTYSKVTEYSRRVLAAAAAGMDATNIGGYNLVQGIYNHAKMTSQGLNGPIYGLLALDAGGYAVPASAPWNADKLIAEIVSKQLPDGGFALTGDKSDPDLTAMALTALSAHRDQTAAAAAVDKAADWLSVQQQAGGGYGDSSESVAQAIIALTSAGIDPTEARFTKSGVSLVDRLLSYRNGDGGFGHTLKAKSDELATEQALLALDAYTMLKEGKGALYRFPVSQAASAADTAGKPRVQIVIEGPEKPVLESELAAANVLDALKALNQAPGIGLEISHASFGDYVSGVKGVQNGLYGGYDGWSYAVQRAGEWIFPSVGMDKFELKTGDRAVVYYGGGDTQVVDAVYAEPALPEHGKPFRVHVTKAAMDWESGKAKTAPAAGVTVKVGSAAAVTDADGNAAFAAIPSGGQYALEVNGYRKGQAPDVVRYTGTLAVLPLYADSAQIADWAAASVNKVYASKLMDGISDGGKVRFAPKASLTRAQFAALLVRLSGVSAEGAAQPGFTDVKPGAWYYSYVAKAKELGFVGGVTATSFQPNAPISRQDMAVMLARSYGLKASASAPSFSDQKQIAAYARDAVRAAAEKGYLSGAYGKFLPDAPVTREMAAVVADRLQQDAD